MSKQDLSEQLRNAAAEGKLDQVKSLLASKADVNQLDKKGFAALHWAVIRRDVDAVQYLIRESKAAVDQVAKDGRAPLMLAVQSGQLSTVKCLVQEKADVYQVDNGGATALHAAAAGGHVDVTKYLVQEVKVAVNHQVTKEKHGVTPLMLAARDGKLPVVRCLVQECKADVNLLDKEGYAALHKATNGNHVDIVQYLVQEGKAAVNSVDKQGRSSLMVAAAKGYLPMALCLVQQLKASVNQRDEAGMTALHWSAFEGNVDIAQFLVLEGKAVVDQVDKYGRSPLILAIEKNHLPMVQCLVQECKADNLKYNGKTASQWAKECGFQDIADYLMPLQLSEELINAACKGDLDRVKSLLASKADVDKPGGDSYTALHNAATEGHVEVVRYLIEAKAAVNKVIRDKRTPLMLAAEEGRLPVVQCLIQEYKADVHLQNVDGWTALHWASAFGSMEVAGYLVREGKAVVNQVTKDGRTPLMIAADLYGDLGFPMVRFLVEKCRADVNIQCKGKTASQQSRFPVIANYLAPLEAASLNKATGGEGGQEINQGSANELKLSSDQSSKNNPIAQQDLSEQLRNAAAEGKLDQVKSLLASKADANQQDKDGRTALHYAVREKHVGVAQYLVREGKASVNQATKKGSTSLTLAAQIGHLPMVRYLVECKADVNLQHNGKTASQWAKEKGFQEIANYLAPLEAASSNKAAETVVVAQIEQKIQQGNINELKASLDKASKNNPAVQQFLQQDAVRQVLATKLPIPKKQELLESVINQGASVTEPNAQGQTPIELARKTESKEIVICLQQAEIIENEKKEAALLEELKVPTTLPVTEPRIESKGLASAEEASLTVTELVNARKIQRQALQQLRVQLAQLPAKSTTTTTPVKAPPIPPPRVPRPAPAVTTPLAFTDEQKQQFLLAQEILEWMLSDFFVRSLAISRGLAGDKDLNTADKISSVINFFGAMIPLPCAGLAVKLLTMAGQAYIGKKSQQKHERQSLQIATLRQAADMLDELVRGLLYRYQFILMQLSPASVEPFIISIIQRMFSYLNLLADSQSALEILGDGLVNVTQLKSPSLPPRTSSLSLTPGLVSNIAKNLVIGTSLWESSASKWRLEEKPESLFAKVATAFNRKVVDKVIVDDNVVLFRTPNKIEKSTTVEKIARYCSMIAFTAPQRYRHCHPQQPHDSKIQQEVAGLEVIVISEEEADLRCYTYSALWAYQLHVNLDAALLIGSNSQLAALKAENEALKQENFGLKKKNEELETENKQLKAKAISSPSLFKMPALPSTPPSSLPQGDIILSGNRVVGNTPKPPLGPKPPAVLKPASTMALPRGSN